MNRIQSILYYVEEDVDLAALKRVVAIADAIKARITVGTVVRPARSQAVFTRDQFDVNEVERLLVADRERHLDDVLRGLDHPNVEIETRVFVGDPADAIIRAVLQGDYDVLAKLPTYNHGLRQPLFGSTDMRLMRACPCPVFIGRVKPTGYSGRIVAAVDYDEGDQAKANLNEKILGAVALMLTEEFRMVREAYIVHAWSLYGESLLTSRGSKSPPARFQKAKQQEEKKRRQWLIDVVERFKSTLESEQAETFVPKLNLLHGDPIEVVPENMNELNADVLVMGTVSRSGLGSIVIGNTAEAILNRVDCSVVTFKPEGFVTPVPRHRGP